MNDLLAEAAFQAWKVFARHTPRKYVNGAPETTEEAYRRRFAELPERTIAQFEDEARAVLRVASERAA